jgi:AcrR family transcriptional regulator
MVLATRNESRRGAMRDRILDATERLLARLGYQKMTMDDVAREAGISKRTIYLHFPSKEEVALGSIDRIGERLKERLRALAAGGGGPADRLRRMLLERVLFRFDSVRDYYEGIDAIFRSLRAAYMARRRRYFDEEAAVFAAVLAEGKSSGALAVDDPPAAAHTLLLATNALLPSALSTRELGDREEVRQRAERIADVLLNGLLRRDPDPAPRPGDLPKDTRDGG